MSKNGFEVGDFVEIYPRQESPMFNDHIGIIFDFAEREEEGTSARILWLTKDCFLSVHWDTFMLKKVHEPRYEDVDLKKLLKMAARWFEGLRYGLE